MLNFTQHNYNMKSKEEIEKLAEKQYPIEIGGSMRMPNTNDIKKANEQEGFIKGYTQCQEDMADEIQSLIDVYKSNILKLKEEFKDTCSALTLEKIVTLESVVENLESKFNKKD